MRRDPSITRRRCGVALLLTAFALVAFAVPGGGVCFQLDRGAVATGAWWRLVTGHFAHWSADHLFWDVAVFLLLATLCEMRSRTRMLVCILAAAVVISAGVWIALPSIETFRGLSGIDSALFVLLVMDLLRGACCRRDSRTVVVLAACLGAFAAKMAYELVVGRTLFVDPDASSMIPVPLAHVLGGVVGALVATCRRRQPAKLPPFPQELSPTT